MEGLIKQKLFSIKHTRFIYTYYVHHVLVTNKLNKNVTKSNIHNKNLTKQLEQKTKQQRKKT